MIAVGSGVGGEAVFEGVDCGSHFVAGFSGEELSTFGE